MNKSIIDDIFSNIFMLAVVNRLDLSEIVSFVDKIMEENEQEGKISDEKYSGLVFVNLIAKEMGISVSDVINNDKKYQLNLMKQIIESISMDGIVIDIGRSESDEEESYITYVLNGLRVFEKTAKLVECDDGSISDTSDNEANEYLIELAKSSNDECSMSILTNNLNNSKYFRGQVEVWKESNGLLSDFFEDVIEENYMLAYKEGISEEELVACVFDDTRTVNLMDRFEGFGEKNVKTYERMIIKNGIVWLNYGDPYVHLVLKRRTSNNIVGDITMTQFKLGEISDLKQHIIEELDSNIINNYLDKNMYYEFKIGYLLRAQNSKNRSGYGWLWNWENGVGKYIKGTEYGETTDYVIAGAYISSSFLFDSNNRIPMMKIEENPQEIDPILLKNSNNFLASEANNNNLSVPYEENNTNIDSENESDISQEIQIFDIDMLRNTENRPEISVNSTVKYKKLHTNEVVETIIGETKLLHKKFIGKKQGDIILDGSKSYLIINVIP